MRGTKEMRNGNSRTVFQSKTPHSIKQAQRFYLLSTDIETVRLTKAMPTFMQKCVNRGGPTTV